MMAVRQTNIFEVAPENMEAFVALIPEARALIEKHGGSVRVWQATVAGPNTGNILGQTELDSMTAYGAFTDALNADPDFQALAQKAAALGTLVSYLDRRTGVGRRRLSADRGGAPPRDPRMFATGGALASPAIVFRDERRRSRTASWLSDEWGFGDGAVIRDVIRSWSCHLD